MTCKLDRLSAHLNCRIFGKSFGCAEPTSLDWAWPETALQSSPPTRRLHREEHSAFWGFSHQIPINSTPRPPDNILWGMQRGWPGLIWRTGLPSSESGSNLHRIALNNGIGLWLDPENYANVGRLRIASNLISSSRPPYSTWKPRSPWTLAMTTSRTMTSMKTKRPSTESSRSSDSRRARWTRRPPRSSTSSGARPWSAGTPSNATLSSTTR